MKKFKIVVGLLLSAASTCACARPIADVHAHIIPPEYSDMLKRHGAELEETFPLPAWDAERHVEFMDKAGIRFCVLTLPAPQPYFGDADESAREAVYALDVLGADGVKLATNSRGQYLGDESLDPLMEVLNARRAVIIVHPHRPTPYPREVVATTPLAMYEYQAETTRAIVNMLARNVLVRYPNLKVVVPHCGSFLPLALPRMNAILPAMLQKGYMRPIDWEKNLARLYYDLAGNPTREVIKSLLTIAPPEHILYGSDYPYMPDSVLRGNLDRLKKTLADDRDLSAHADDFL